MTAPEGLPRLWLAVRRHGPQLLVVCEPDGRTLEGLPEGLQDAGGPVELAIATELLARIAEAAPEPLADVAGECIGQLAEALADAAAEAAFAWSFGEGAEA